MPIDPSIPLQTRGIDIDPNAFMRAFGMAQENQRRNLEAETLAAQRDAAVEARKLQIAEAKRQEQSRGNLALAVQAGGGVRDKTLEMVRLHAPEHVADVTKFFDDADERAAKIKKLNTELATERQNHLGHIADNVLRYGVTPENLDRAFALYAEQFPDEADAIAKTRAQFQQMPPPAIEQQLTMLRDAAPYYQAQQAEAAKRGPDKVSPGEGVFNKTTGKYEVPVPKEPTKPQSAQEFEYRASLPSDQRAAYDAYQTDDANRHRPVTNIMTGQTDPKSIADAIVRGELPPDLTQYGRQVSGAIASALAAQGFNLSGARLDWDATKKHVQTMNGAQQLRLGQAVNALPDLLDSVDALAEKWGSNLRLPVLNKANLALAKNGAYGQEWASVARQLETQIKDVVGDLGTVYMGGNSPTDKGLKLAESALSSDWDAKTLRDMVKLAKANVVIRRNSMQNTGVAGASPSNPYAPPAPKPEDKTETPYQLYLKGRKK